MNIGGRIPWNGHKKLRNTSKQNISEPLCCLGEKGNTGILHSFKNATLLLRHEKSSAMDEK